MPSSTVCLSFDFDALSVWLAIRDAVSSLSADRRAALLDAPATPERVLRAVEAMRADGAKV